MDILLRVVNTEVTSYASWQYADDATIWPHITAQFISEHVMVLSGLGSRAHRDEFKVIAEECSVDIRRER